MAAISIRITDHSYNGGQIHISGTAYVAGSDEIIGWGTDVNFSTTVAGLNNACVNAAIAAAEALNYTIGGLDNRTLIGGAVGL